MPDIEVPVGATWDAMDTDGTLASVWLEERMNNVEVWRFIKTNRDGSRYSSIPWKNSDWATSYDMAVNLASINGRFKRRKET